MEYDEYFLHFHEGVIHIGFPLYGQPGTGGRPDVGTSGIDKAI